jgi:polar amino acid transport system substrate-binding protein
MGLRHLGSGSNRRQFLKTSATTAALAVAVPSIVTVLTKNAMAATTVENIKKAGIVRVGCEAAYRPFAFREGNKIVGYDIELASSCSLHWA